MPVAFFQALGRTERDSAQSDGGRPPTATKNPDHDSGYSESSSMQPAGMSGMASMSGLASMAGLPAGQRISKSGKSGQMVYGIVMYDFAAERADELEAKAGDAIIIIAQSNPEWFVAKPIGRLGGPGLIPVSFVELRDMTSDRPINNPSDALKKAGVPKVEEWKKMAAEYKNSSITLGKFEGGMAPGQSMEQGMERLSLQQGGRQDSQHGSQVLFLTRKHASPANQLVRTVPRVNLGLHNSRSSRISTRPSRIRNFSRPSKPGYLDTVLQRISTGSLSRRHWRMAETGNSRDTMRTFTTFRLRSLPSSLPRLAIRVHRSDHYHTCQDLSTTSQTQSPRVDYTTWTHM